MQLIVGVVIGVLLIIAGPLLLFISIRMMTSEDISDRLEEMSGTHANADQNPVPEDVYAQRVGITGNIVERVIKPFFRKLAHLLGRLTPAQSSRNLDRKLMLAGQPMGIGAREFFGIRLLVLIISLFLAFLLLRIGDDNLNRLGALLAVVVGALYPTVWLQRKIRVRQQALLKGMPDAMDMLSVCATAGLGFDQSMQRVSEYWETQVGLEFGRIISEMEMGLSRSEALRNFADRSDVPEISSFVSLIVQAEHLGMSIAHTVNSMAEQMRIERRFKAQEEIRKLPNKILFPLAFFIFPSMIAVILGPSLPALVDLFAYLGQ